MNDIKELLDFEAKRINNPDFIAEDPVQFPRRFSKQQDIEIAAFLSAIIAWGRRQMICRDAERMFALMNHQPFDYVMDKGYEDLNPSQNIHRTFFTNHLQYFLRGLRRIYRENDSLDAFALKHHVGEAEMPAWELVAAMQKIMLEENNSTTCPQCLPTNLQTTALKRINMALRWLVRDDGIVDLGIWKSIPKSKLYIPLDVHVGNTSRGLGLLTRKANDRKSVMLLTETLRKFNPEDPVIYDYALFGIGIENKSEKKTNKLYSWR